MKVYVVKKGYRPGIYHSWPEAEEQVKGFPGAEYKSFSNIMEALDYQQMDPEDALKALQGAEDNLQAAIAKVRQGGSKKKQAENKKEFAASSKYAAHIFTDGGCRNNGTHKGRHVQADDKAAWAYLIEYGGQKLSASGGRFGATNNEMEMTAFLESLKKLEELGLNDQPLLFSLDSQYVIKAVSDNDQGPAWIKGWQRRGWKKADGSPVANRELWQEIAKEIAKFAQPEFEWVKGHANSAGNNFVDGLLNKYMDQM
ncbi:ribonuclease [Lactobacillus delbrueckii subsp. lactis]|uniref:ribonuclease H family protein n=1 Tax=Lactobacillus delbrueckii TaxID=1584 RepID=UPI001E442553|nr:ribonuclease H family protein [Lactobacillus delbrueckii]MCD5442553.1 ribonuclease H family protein [Lactobacillus delbrueckii subsp. lactis]MCD5530903.1 ribonuclease H family protein [Lactobacillus delbrueckii subsp. lactis]MCS8614772.1 ribonuclease [Lactobacillus delbrueckii subsp. lactis]